MEKYYYLLINIFTISFPLLASFEPRVHFFSRRRGLFLGIGIAAVFFIIWDIAFTRMGIWGFNPHYLTGIDFLHLPIEEWMFFFTVPYACIFIYETLNYGVKKELPAKITKFITYTLIAVLFILGIMYVQKWYTGLTFILTALFLLLLVIRVKPRWLGRFYLAYLVSLIPFLLVNGILTGSFIPDQIVWYNNAENLSIRIFTIPVEDSIYMMLLLLMSISVYEHWKEKNNMTTF
jgi:lycopene cyclase domain-containing protein